MNTIEQLESAILHIEAIIDGVRSFRKVCFDDYQSSYNIGALETADEIRNRVSSILFQLEQNLDHA